MNHSTNTLSSLLISFCFIGNVFTDDETEANYILG